MFLRMLGEDFAWGIKHADARLPVALNHRSGASYQAGIGPHTEASTITLVFDELHHRDPRRYRDVTFGVPYLKLKRQRCDLVLSDGTDKWYVEVKMMRLLGDNGKPNDNMLMHIISPYPQHRSALTDCAKLTEAGFEGRLGVIIFGYDYPGWPLEPVIEAFETLAATRVHLTRRPAADFDSLVHPVHRRGRVFAWEVEAGNSTLPASVGLPVKYDAADASTRVLDVTQSSRD
jgi:hypothetical protein